MTTAQILAQIRALGNEHNRKGMARYGINVARADGVSVRELRAMARTIGGDHALAVDLWATGRHEARILATLIGDPEAMTEAEMEAWVADVDSWDLCDGLCNNLIRKTPHAWDKALEWSRRDAVFVRRAGFSLMANLAVHDKRAGDAAFRALLPIIIDGAGDQRNFVKKAVNWALRQIGKRNRALNRAALAGVETIAAMDGRAARWIAADARRELTSDKVQGRLRA